MECFQTTIATKIIEQSLATAGVNKQTAAKIMGTVSETKSADGKVMLVQTNMKDRDIYVGGMGTAGVSFTIFKFPLNPASFETELIRAQETHRGITVIYSINAKNEKIITTVMLYGKGAYSE